MFASVHLGVSSSGGLSTWILSTWESGHITICPRRIVSTMGSINSGYYSRLVLSTWDYVHKGHFLFEIMPTWHSVHLRVWLLGSCPLVSLATRHSARLGLLSLLVLSALDSAHAWFCLLGGQSTWVNVYLESVHLEVWPQDILPT